MQNKLRLSPEIAMDMLREGNEHFLRGELRRPQLGPVSMAANAQRQKPFAVVITCADSRMSPELIFDCGIGDIFVTRTAGNVVDGLVTGSVEYAVKYLDSPLVLVMGHTRCGAVQSAIAGQELEGGMSLFIEKIAPAVAEVRERCPELDGEALEDEVAQVNVRLTLLDMLNSSEILREAVEAGRVSVCGAVCDITSGAVAWLDSDVVEEAVVAQQ